MRKEILILAKLLDKYKVKYLILGGLASTRYGTQRATYDIDVVVKKEDIPENFIVPCSNPQRAAPSASKYGASSGTISSGISSLRYSIIIRLLAEPPVTIMFRLSTFFKSSSTLLAIILQSPAVTFDLGIPLLVA